MGKRIAIVGLAGVGVLLLVVAIGSYKGWFELFNDPGRVSSSDSASAAHDTTTGAVVPSVDLSRTVARSVTETASGWDPEDEEPPTEYAIEGYITSVDGGAIRGASIEILRNRSLLFSHEALRFLEDVGRPEPPLASGQTGADGTFRIVVSGPGRFFIKAEAIGYSSVVEGPIRVHQAEPVAALSIPLPIGYSISGTVKDGVGHPIVGVSLFLMQKGNLGHSYYNHETRSGPDGRFSFDGLEPTGYVLMAPPQPGGGGTHGTLISRLTAPTHGLEIALERGRRFRGRVVEGARPASGVPGATVTLLNPVSYAQIKTDENGAFEAFLKGPDAEIVIEHEAYRLYESRVDLEEPGSVEFALDRGAVLSGRILFPNGPPASEIELGLLQSSRFLGSLLTTRTDDAGRFEFKGIDPDQLVYMLPRVADYWIPFGTVEAGQREVDIELQPTAILTGLVTGTQGIPLDTVWVHLQPMGGDIASRAAYWLRGESEGWTDSSGRFVFEDVIPGVSYLVRASTAGVADGSLEIDGVPMDPVVITLTPGATIDFTLESEDGSGIPRGAILVASWKGAPDVQRTPSGALEGGMRFHVDSYGRVIVDDVPAGIATFYFTCAGYVDKRVRLDVKAGEIHARIVAMELAGELVVTTATDAGEPIPMTFVQVFSTTGEYSASRRTDPSGTCSFGSLPKGQYTVFAIGFPPRTVRVTGETVDIELRSQDR